MPDHTKPEATEPLSVGMLLYPGFTLLDLAGPQTAFGIVGKTHLIWKTMEPVPTDMGVSMNPTMTFADVPDNLDVLFVPGGFGTVEAMQDKEILEFLAKAGSTARYVTSVCTGSVILGMAGLLEGYRAATHWDFRPKALIEAALRPLEVTPTSHAMRLGHSPIDGRDTVTMGIGFGIAEFGADSLLEPFRDEVFQPLGFIVQFLDGVVKHLEQEGLDEAMVPDDLKSPASTCIRKAHTSASLIVDPRIVLGGQLLQHVGDRSRCHVKPLGQL